MEKLAAAFGIYFGIYIGICGFVWALFVRLDPLLKKDTRKKIANWVSGSKHGDADTRTGKVIKGNPRGTKCTWLYSPESS